MNIVLFVSLFLSLIHLIVGEDQDLVDALSKAAGVFKSPERTEQYKLQNTVVITASNFGYLNHLYNFRCFIERLEMKFFLIVVDHYLANYLQKKPDEFIYYYIKNSTYGTSTEKASKFMTEDFNRIAHTKFEVVAKALNLGYDILFTDADIAILRDPFPYLLWTNVDHVHSQNTPCGKKKPFAFYEKGIHGNTGFYFLRSTVGSKALLEYMLGIFKEKSYWDDQTLFWEHMKNITDPVVRPMDSCEHIPANHTLYLSKVQNPRTVLSCPLDECVFSAGMLRNYAQLKHYLHERNEQICTAHANWIVGSHLKQQAMLRTGLWLFDGSFNPENHENPIVLAKCRPFVAPRYAK